MENSVEKIRVKSNYQKRTFTIRMSDIYGDVFAKYKTCKMSKQEFDDAEHFTENDWKAFLKLPGNYYEVK